MFHTLYAGLQQPASFEPDPDPKHRGITRANSLYEGRAGTQLSKDGQGTVHCDQRVFHNIYAIGLGGTEY
jgi:hypothetical protein